MGGEVMIVARNTHPDWLRLDNAAKIYPATRTEEWSAVFRLAVVLKRDIDAELLKQSLDVAVRRFPSLYVQMRHGAFWYFLDRPPAGMVVRPEPESMPPCRPLRDADGVVFRVLYHGPRLSVEFFHVLTDGSGAMEFLKALTADYLTRCGLLDEPVSGVLSLHEDPLPREWEDSFARYADPAAHGSRAEPQAWQVPGQPLKQLMVTHGLCPVADIKRAAKAMGVTITEYLTGLLLTIYSGQKTDNRPVKIMIPVNLRNYFPSFTLRNFSSYVNVTQEEDTADVASACQLAHRQLTEQARADVLNHRMSLNVNSERNVFVRLAPLPIKRLVLKAAFAMYGENLFTASLSNLGLITLPEAMGRHIERFDFTLGAPYKNAHAFAVIGFGDTLTITVTRTIRESWVERALFSQLSAAGVPVSIIANQEVLPDEV